MFERFYDELRGARIVPVVVLDHIGDAIPLARALATGGIRMVEVTLRTPAASEAIRDMSRAQPSMVLGAGTVTSVDQADEAVAAGASFIVSPHYDEEIVRHCIERGVPVVPGAVTPTEIAEARRVGLRVTKFFPAEQYGGVSTIEALAGPFAGHRFMPTGGVSVNNLEAYLSSAAVIACGGTWMVKPALFCDGDFSLVTARAREAVDLAHRA